MRFSFRSRTVAGGEDKRVKKIPFLAIFGLKSKKAHIEHVTAAVSTIIKIVALVVQIRTDRLITSVFIPKRLLNQPDLLQLIPKRTLRGRQGNVPSPNLSLRQTSTQFDTHKLIAGIPAADLYFRSPESDRELKGACYARPSRCPSFYEEDCESEETLTLKDLKSSAIASATDTFTSPLSVGHIASHGPVPVFTASAFSTTAFSFMKTFTRPSQASSISFMRVTLSMESIPEEEHIFAPDTPGLEFTHEDDSCPRLFCCPGFHENCESEETPAFNTSNSPASASATRVITSALSFGQVPLHELIPISAASPFSPAAFSFTKIFARPSQAMAFSMESIPEEIEVEEITAHSISPRSSCLSQPSMLNLERPCAEPLYREDQQETVAWCCEPKGLGLFTPFAAISSSDILRPYLPLELVADDQTARSLSPIAASLTSSPDHSQPSLSSSTSPLPSTTFDFSSLCEETTSISPGTSVDEHQRSGRSSFESGMSSKDCLEDADRWSLEPEIQQEKFHCHTFTAPMEALLGALFPKEYPHLAPTPPSIASNRSSAHTNILCESPAPTPSSSYLLPEPLASSPSMSDADSGNLSEESIDTPSASTSQDRWKFRVSMCDIHELARRENERLERFGPQHSIAEALRLLDIAELSLPVSYRH
ncbi:hypothetical protein FRB98_009742 [Tulasnella sp. 332]|nr:hypothetical protein FRB98_009742 [Tulasnella sp. 332]